MSRYPPLPDDLRVQLSAVTPTDEGGIPVWPCDVILKNGRHVPCVYFMSEVPYYHLWGVWPEEDRGKYPVRVEDVATIEESQSRLPVALANKLCAAGETGMGYCVFTILFDDGSQLPVVNGNAVDFINYPSGKGPANVVDVLPHIGRDDPKLQRGPKFYWCLFSGNAEI